MCVDADSRGPGTMLDQELHRLADKYRAPVILCEFEGRTHKEVARHLGWPERTLSVRLMTANSAKATTTAMLALSTGILQSRDPKVKVDFPWRIKAGSVLTIDRGQATEETIVVQSIQDRQIQIGGTGFLQ